MSERGKYIVGEGGDGTGKTTQILMLDDHIRSLGGDTLRVYNEETDRYEPIQEPGGTPLANELRKRIKDKSIDRTPWDNVVWLTDARVSTNEELIQPALEKGEYVLSGRNWFSTVIYQGYGQGVPIDEITDYTRERVGEKYMTPDMAVIFAIQKEVERQKRLSGRSGTDVRKDTFESLGDDFQERMRQGYISFSEERDIALVDASGKREEVFKLFLKHAEPLLGDLLHQPKSDSSPSSKLSKS